MKKLTSKIIQIVTALSLGAAMLPGVPITAGAQRTETVDLLLNSDGTVKDRVGISAHWTAAVLDDNEEDTGKRTEVTETDGWDTVLTNTLTEQGQTQKGKYYGWGPMIKATGYIQLDLGEVSDISKIEFAPFIDAQRNTYWGTGYTVSLSNNADFSNKIDIATNHTFLTAANEDGTYTLKAFEPETGSTWQYRYIRFSSLQERCVGSSKIKVTGTKTYIPQDLLHNDDGTLKATLTASNKGIKVNEGSLDNIESICDGKYDIEYNDAGSLNLDKASSFVAGWNGTDKEWVKIDLGEVKSIDNIRVLLYPGTSSNEAFAYFRDGVSIQASNNPSFSSFKTLATTTEEHQNDRNKWLEYSSTDYTDEYRYIRIYATKQRVIGITEVQITGYDLCSASLCYTNIDEAIMSSSSDTSKPKVSNVSNSNIKRGIAFTPNFCIVNDKIQLVFTGEVDAASVDSTTIKLTQTYFKGNNATENVGYTPNVDGNTVYIDPACLQSYAAVTVEVTSGVKVNGMAVTPKTIMFNTADIAPLAYRDGKVIRNVASGKNAIASAEKITNRLANPLDQNWNYVTDNGIGAGKTEPYILVDLGNEYNIDAFGVDGPSYPWHLAYRDIYISDKFEELQNQENKVHKSGDNSFSGMMHPRETLKNTKKARYILIVNIRNNELRTGERLDEFTAYAYAPENPDGNIEDAYFKRNTELIDEDANTYGIKNLTFYVEGDIAEGTAIIIAGYNGEVLTEVKATNTDKRISIPIEYAKNGKVKAFVWNNTSEMKPLTDSAEF